MKNYQAILMCVVGFGLAYGTMNGNVQNYVNFAGELNEMAFTLLTGMVGVMGIFAINYKKLIKSLI